MLAWALALYKCVAVWICKVRISHTDTLVTHAPQLFFIQNLWVEEFFTANFSYVRIGVKAPATGWQPLEPMESGFRNT